MLKKIMSFLLYFLSFIFFLLFFLFNGININSISFGDFSVSQLYIKMDKKLIVNIEEIKLKSNKSKVHNSLEDIKSIINKVPTVLQFFQTINIDSLEIEDNKISLIFNNEHIYINNKYINFTSKYEVNDNILDLNLYSLELKDLDLLLYGKIQLDTKNFILNFFGDYIYKNDVYGEINYQISDEFIDFFINSKETKDIKFLKDFLNLDSIAESWMYDNIKGEMSLDYLYGKIDTKTLSPILDSIEGSASIKNATIDFNKKLEHVHASSIELTYDNDNLKLDLIKPKYKDINIDGSFVNISNMTSKEKGRVDVHIKAVNQLDDKVLNLLKAYDINLPIKQVEGKVDALVVLKIPYNAPLSTYGEFYTRNSNLLLQNFPFYTKKATVILKNSDIIIKDTDFIHKDMIDSNVNLTIDLNTLKAKGNANIKSFIIKSEKDEIIHMHDKKTDISMNFSDSSDLILDSFDTKLEFNKQSTDVYIRDLNTIYPYSKLLQDLNIKDGDIKLYIKDPSNIKFTTNVNGLDTPLSKDGKMISSFRFDGMIKANNVSLTTPSEDLKIRIKNDDVFITANDYDIVYKSNDKKEHLKDLNVRLTNSNININDKENFYSKYSNIKILKDKVTFNGVFEKLDIPLSKNGKDINSLDVIGTYQNNEINLKSKDNDIKIKIVNDENLIVDLKNMDFKYDTEGVSSQFKTLEANAVNSNIIINNRNTVLADNYNFFTDHKKTSFNLKYKNAEVKYSKNEESEIELSAKGINDKFVNTFFNKDIVSGGNFIVSATGKDDIIQGKMFFDNNRIKNLAVLNNLIVLVNTSPAIINPLLAIPSVFGMVTKDGFNLTGYKITKGFVDFVYNKKDAFLNLKNIHTVGNSVDFEGYATVDLNSLTVNSKMELVFMKDYSKIINFLPGLNYILLGDDKKVSTTVDIKGDLSDPKIESHIAKDSVSVPIDILKRIITAPFKLFD